MTPQPGDSDTGIRGPSKFNRFSGHVAAWHLLSVRKASVLIVGVTALGFAWLSVGSHAKQFRAPPRPALLHTWSDPTDRANLRSDLHALSDVLDIEVSHIQLDIYRDLDDLNRTIGTPDANESIQEVSDLRSRLVEIKAELTEKCINGCTYADEVKDVLRNTEIFDVEAVALGEYVRAVSAIQSALPNNASGTLASSEHAAREANFRLADWVGDSMNRLRDKQAALTNQ